jgi:hypothetical protein
MPARGEPPKRPDLAPDIAKAGLPPGFAENFTLCLGATPMLRDVVRSRTPYLSPAGGVL